MNLEELGSEWSGKVYVYWNTEYGWLQVSQHSDWADDDSVLLGESGEITVPLIPRDEMVNRQIDHLKAESQRVLAKSQAQLDEIDQRIQSLLAIEHKEGE